MLYEPLSLSLFRFDSFFPLLLLLPASGVSMCAALVPPCGVFNGPSRVYPQKQLSLLDPLIIIMAWHGMTLNLTLEERKREKKLIKYSQTEI